MSYIAQSVLASFQLNDYTSGMAVLNFQWNDLTEYHSCDCDCRWSILTPVCSVLTFSSEIEHVWKKPWTLVSTLFIVVRYVGLLNVTLGALSGTPFMPGPVITFVLSTPSPKDFTRTTLYLIGSWTFLVFLAATDLSMILRVYAMYNRPRLILVILLGIYIPTIAVLVVSAAIYDNTDLSVTPAEVVHSQSCAATFTTTSSIVAYALIPRFIIGILLFILAVTQFVRESLEMYKAIKQWRSNRYMELLVRESILYFIANLLYNVACLVAVFGMPANLMLTVGSDVVPYVVAPRFVLSVRELHSCVVGNHIDTGFGADSQRTNNNTILFATHGMMPALETVRVQECAESLRKAARQVFCEAITN
ncbi:hypothetical protein BU15DRAFT_82006 [Melanogaster broomeanus]|nr:hypothetical protein BU15DRAFT_82006 [Melanogaster broomeanus]